MFGPTSDEYGLLHRGTRVRKMHSSYRSTFRTIGATPLATVARYPNPTGSHFTYISDDFLRREEHAVQDELAALRHHGPSHRQG